MAVPVRTRFFTSCVAAFQGGGCRAAALVGAVDEALSRGVNFVEFAGTSAGSIVAALMGAGATAANLKAVVSTIDFTDLFTAGPEDLGTGVARLPLPFRALLFGLKFTRYGEYRTYSSRLGLHSSSKIEAWMNLKLQELLAKGIQKAKRSAPNVPVTTFCNWPTELCIGTYQDGIARLWVRRLHIFMGIFLGLITWQVVETVKIGYPSFVFFLSPKSIPAMAKVYGWMSAIFEWIFLTGFIIAGFVKLIQFLYKKVWWDWFGAYGSSLLGCVEKARQNPLMRYAPKAKVP